MISILKSNKRKIFCIGANKTGTTSIEKALLDLGFKLGDQLQALNLIESYKIRDFDNIIKFCKKADAFQDAPFSWHYTFIFLDQAYPGSKFILTVRDNEDEWYKSFIKFHSKLYGENGKLPTTEKLKTAYRNSKRTVWENMNARMKMDESNPYNEKRLTAYYLTHNKMVIDYFRFKNNLLIINLKDKNSYSTFCKFINVKKLYDEFPWENSSLS